MRRKAWTPNENSRLCALHFEEECFIVSSGRKRLNSTAVPTIFDYSLEGKSLTAPPKGKCLSHTQFYTQTSLSTHTQKTYTQDEAEVLDKDSAIVTQDSSETHIVSDVMHHNYTAKASESDTDEEEEQIQDTSVSVEKTTTTTTTEHNYIVRESPKSVKRQLETQLLSVEEKLESCRKKLKLEKEKTKRLKQKVDSLAEVISVLKQKSLISSGCAEMLENSFSGVPKEILIRVEHGKRSKVSEELRSFAMTLHFYSAKAYAYVRECFDLALPHPDTIRTWYSNISADPGFTKASFCAIQAHAQDRTKEGKETICALMMDEMAIRKHVELSAGKFHGYVDLGCGTVDDSLPPARDALVIMAVAVDQSWKIPVAYFFVDALTGEERANIISECLQRLHIAGVHTVSLTCDRPTCHFAMLRALGADLDVNSMRPSFPNPADTLQVVHVVLDVCHMMKLLRNTMAEAPSLQTTSGKIKWQYIVELNKLQETEGLRLGNKLKMAHIRWERQKMKVKLATQVFSSSVADALEYCNKHLHLPQFSGCEETVDFLRTIDAAFDVLNSRNPLGKGYKAPMRTSNKECTEKILLKAEKLLLDLKDAKGVPLHAGK